MRQRMLMTTVFQFHKGTIRTSIEQSRRGCGQLNFNSIKVQLERTLLQCFLQLSKNFNSIKVQLEPAFLSFALCVLPQFQFHKGTIRTMP